MKNMGKTKAFALTAMLALSLCPMSALAAGPGAPEEKDLTATYEAGEESATVYSVEIAWGNMNFTYKGASEGTWNAETHQFEGGAAASWSHGTEAGAGTVKVVNHSNAPVNAAFSYQSEAAYTQAAGTFDITSDRLEAGTAGGYDTADSVTAVLSMSGSLPAAQSAAKIGTVTVTVSQPQTSEGEGGITE